MQDSQDMPECFRMFEDMSPHIYIKSEILCERPSECPSFYQNSNPMTQYSSQKVCNTVHFIIKDIVFLLLPQVILTLLTFHYK